MCGIAGFIDPSLRNDEAEKTITSMLRCISHRGPDATQNWIQLPVVLGHNRLSIIDLSEDGNQPMHHFDSAIIFNGEIYNYIEVRDELINKGYKFQTKSDTEVILAAYREYGRNCVNKFVGMWAFALWDKLTSELFCSRDRFGIKPFYYIHEGDKFYFGSEYKVLKQTSVFSNELNLDQVSRGLQLGWVCYDDETYFSKMKSLPAGCNLTFKNSKIQIDNYWDLNANAGPRIKCIDDAKGELYKLLTESVSIHMRSDVEIAICLSGGIDSSTLTGFMTKVFPQNNFKSYSIYYDGKNEVDERPFINAVVNKYPSILPRFYNPKPNEIIERFDKIMHQVDVPSTGSSNFSHYYLLEKIKEEGIKVVVDGQGADEYLAGYMHAMYRYNGSLIRSLSLRKLIANVNQNSKNQSHSVLDLYKSLGKSALSTVMDEMKLYSLEYKNYFPFLVKIEQNKIPFKLKRKYDDPLSNFLYHQMFHTSLPTILHYVDRMTMAHSVESRVPFLDHRLVEFAFRLDNNLKISKGVTKRVLRETAKDLLPQEVYCRKDKKGFVTPGENIWLRGAMKHLLDIDYSKMDFLQKEKTKNLINEYKAGDNRNSKLIWRVATLNYWIKKV
jgi:asparagine synthase (glutamine-hydrolysing)